MVLIPRGGVNVRIFEFINIVGDAFKSQIAPDPTTHKINSKVIYATVLEWFTDMSIMDIDRVNAVLYKSLNFCNKLLNGNLGTDVPIKDAAYLKSKLIASTMKDVIHNANLSPVALNVLIEKFKEKGETITKGNLAKNLRDVLFKLLDERSKINRKGSIRNAQFLGDDKVQIGKKIISLPAPLEVPNLPDIKEEKYISALLTVYAQKEKRSITSIEDLDGMPLYKENIQIHRSYFYSAESVLYQIRDFFNDSVKEFDGMKKEIYEGISYHLNSPHKNGWERLDDIMKYVVTISFKKSYLSKPGNGLIGPNEERGMVHMLVNDGKIEWIKEYDDETI